MKSFVAIIALVLLIGAVNCNAPVNRSNRRLRIPFLGIGPQCSGCPPHFCDDDPAIVHGFCCGCARFYDNLPVRCTNLLNCPLNGQTLCEDYEYMMHCCCQ